MKSIIELFPSPLSEASGADQDVGCRYIESEVKSEWVFCGAGRKAKSSYCTHHHKICYLSGEEAKHELARIKTIARSDVGFERAHAIIGDRS